VKGRKRKVISENMKQRKFVKKTTIWILVKDYSNQK